MHPFLIVYAVVTFAASGFLFYFSDRIWYHLFLGFVMFIPSGIFLFMNFRENMYPIYLFVKRPDWVRIKKRLPVIDKYFVLAAAFGTLANIISQASFVDRLSFYAGAFLNMIWPTLDLVTKDAMERHPVIRRKKYSVQ